MVNVPGRSKGCSTCRRRKKGCDQARPACGRCLRDNLECGGYARPAIFVNQYSVSNEPSGVVTIRSKWDQPKEPPLTTFQNVNMPAPIDPLLDQLARSAFEEKYFGAYWESVLPKDDHLPPHGYPQLLSYQWADAVATLSKSSNVLRLVLTTVSVANWARKTGDQGLAKQGFVFYGEALAQLNRLLRNPQVAATDDALLAACQIFGAYEQFNGYTSTTQSPQGRNWKSHIDGLSALILLRGPRNHNTGPAHHFFSSFRAAMFTNLISFRKSSKFAESEWCTLPWAGQEKAQRDQLYDIMLLVPGLLERLDKADRQDSEEGRVSVIGRLLLLHQKLQTWKMNFLLYIRNLEERAGRQVTPESEQNNVGYFLSHGVDIAFCMLNFWTIYIALSGTLRVVSKRVPPEFSIESFQGGDFDAHAYATNVVGCIPYFVHPNAGLVGFQQIAWPVGTVMLYALAFQADPSLGSGFVQQTFFGSARPHPKGSDTFGRRIGTFVRQLLQNSSPALSEPPATEFELIKLRARRWFRMREDLGAQAWAS